MSDAGQAGGRRGRFLYAAGGAALGAVAGTGAALGGMLLRRRKQDDAPPLGDTTGRGLPEAPPSPQATRKGFETEDMSGGLMGLLTIGLGVSIGIAIWLMVMMLHGFQARRDTAPPLTAQQQADLLPPLPRLQPAPWHDLADQERRQLDRLDRYGWTGPGHDRARIPIGIAMGRTVGRSLDATPDAAP